MPLTRGSKTIYVNLSPEVIDFILQTIQDFADEGTQNFIDRLESRLNEITASNEDAKYKVIKSRAEYQIRLITPEFAAAVYNVLFNSREQYKLENELTRKPYIRVGFTLPRWRIIQAIFDLKALVIHREDPELENPELTRSERITLDIAKRFDSLLIYETENRGYKRMTHSV